jgi:hypothetical protein
MPAERSEGLGVGAQDADRGVEMHQVGAELVPARSQGLYLAGQGSAVADQGCGNKVGNARTCFSFATVGRSIGWSIDRTC